MRPRGLFLACLAVRNRACEGPAPRAAVSKQNQTILKYFFRTIGISHLPRGKLHGNCLHGVFYHNAWARVKTGYSKKSHWRVRITENTTPFRAALHRPGGPRKYRIWRQIQLLINRAMRPAFLLLECGPFPGPSRLKRHRCASRRSALAGGRASARIRGRRSRRIPSWRWPA